MARSVYGQLNQANIGQGIDTLLREIFEGDPQKYATEASAIDSITSTASSEAEFEKLDKVLDDFWRRNDMHGPIYEAKEIGQRANYNQRKDEFRRFKQAHHDVMGMTDSSYKVSISDVDGGIQNIKPSDVSSWNHEQLTKELDKVNKMRDSIGLAKNGYKYNPDNTSQTSLSLARDLDTYHKSLMAGLEILVDTKELPDDDILLRHIISGRADKVKEHAQEQQQISANLYKKYSDNLSSLGTLFNKVTAYKDNPDDFAEFFKTLGEEDRQYMGGILASMGGEEGTLMDYSVWADNIAADMETQIGLRDNANRRHKQYTGKLYEEVDDSLRNQMDTWAKEGSSYVSSDELAKIQEENARLKRELEAGQAKQNLADTATAVAESTSTAAAESTGVKQKVTEDVVVEEPEKELSPMQKERRRLQEQTSGFNRQQLARAALEGGMSKAPFEMYLDSIVGDETYEGTKVPKSQKEKYKIDKEIKKKILINDSRIDKLFAATEAEFNKLDSDIIAASSPSGISRQDFGKAIIKTWKGLGYDVRFRYGSFSNFIDAILEDFLTTSGGRDLKIIGVSK